MLSTTLSYGLSGIDGIQITVEVNVSNGLPVFEIVGLPDTAVTEGYGGVAYGVRLSSLALYTYPGFSKLPEDTVLCLRTNTSMGAFLGGNSTKAMHEANLALAWRLLAAPAYVPE